MRRYRHGSTWALWRWTAVRFGGVLYLLRLHLLKIPLGAVMLHWLRGPDPERDLHDHPVGFVSIVLRGGYWERRKNPYPLGGWVVRRVRWFNVMRPTDVHRIIHVIPGTITLVFAGPKVREWGYHVNGCWVPWKRYQEEN